MSRTLKNGKVGSFNFLRGKNYESYALSPHLLLFLGKTDNILHIGHRTQSQHIISWNGHFFFFSFKMHMFDANLISKIIIWNLYPSKRAKWDSCFYFSRCCHQIHIVVFFPSLFFLFFSQSTQFFPDSTVAMLSGYEKVFWLLSYQSSFK